MREPDFAEIVTRIRNQGYSWRMLEDELRSRGITCTYQSLRKYLDGSQPAYRTGYELIKLDKELQDESAKWLASGAGEPGRHGGQRSR